MDYNLANLIEYIMGSILTAVAIITPIVLFFVAYIRNKRAEHELRIRLLENGSDPELAKVLIESKLKKEPKLVLLRVGMPAIFASIFGIIFFYVMNNIYEESGFEGAVVTLILLIVLGIGIGLVSALVIEQKLLKKAEQTK